MILICGLVCLMIEDARGKPSRLLTALGHPMLSGVGAFAYSLYLVHEPLEQVIWQYGVRHLTDSKIGQFLLLLSLSAVVVVWLAKLFYNLFERPFLARAGSDKAYVWLRQATGRPLLGSGVIARRPSV